MAVEDYASGFELEDWDGEADLVQNIVVVVHAAEKGHVYGAEEHTDVGAVGDEAAEDGAREPASGDFDVELFALLEASIGIIVRRVNLYLVVLFFESQCQINNQILCATNAKIRMQNSHFGFPGHIFRIKFINNK